MPSKIKASLIVLMHPNPPNLSTPSESYHSIDFYIRIFSPFRLYKFRGITT